jgi:AraC-like DNA-binding protein
MFLLVGGSGLIVVRKRKVMQRKLNKYKTSTLDSQRAAELVPKLLKLMEQDKIFLQPNLNLKNLSQLLKIHPNHLSRLINQRFEMSFNDFINRHRIEEAKKLLLQKDGEKRNILQIMLDTGFYSKSVFNTAFKKFTGMTPSEFKRHYHFSSEE